MTVPPKSAVQYQPSIELSSCARPTTLNFELSRFERWSGEFFQSVTVAAPAIAQVPTLAPAGLALLAAALAGASATRLRRRGKK